MRKIVLAIIPIFLWQSFNVDAFGEYLYCGQKEYSTSENCNVLSVSKVSQPLESYLGKKYTGYTYSIKNTSPYKVNITGFQHIDYPANTIQQIQDNRVRFPSSVKYFKYVCVWPFLFVFPPLMFAAPDHPLLFLTAPVSVPSAVVWSAIAAPYYAITDKRKDEKAFKETEKYMQYFSNKNIASNEEFQFTALLSGCYIIISYKVDDSNNVYMKGF